MRVIFLFLVILFSVSPQVTFADDLPLGKFKTLPVLNEGRIEPLDSFARHYLQELSGKQGLEDMSANEWLAEMFFDPVTAMDRPVIHVNDRLISFNRLSPLLSETMPRVAAILAKRADGEELDDNETELLDIHGKAMTYSQILRTFSFALPLTLEGYDTPPRFYELWPEIKTIEKKSTNIAGQLSTVAAAGSENALVKVIPQIWDTSSKDWVTPWTIFSGGSGAPQTKNLLELWIVTLKAYEEGNVQSWNEALSELHDEYKKLRGNQVRPLALKLETLNNSFHPVLIITLLYIISTLLLIYYFTSRKKIFLKGGVAVLSLTAFLHGLLILARIFILERAPVATLYESVLFVPLIIIVAAFVIYKIKHSEIALLLSALLAAFLLGVSIPYEMKENTFAPLDAVLNTNFWLGTHVVFITCGYAWCLLASALAQFELAACRNKVFPKTIKIVLLAALFFTTIGTVLGGIWADQSWGRFWGWDPKENGALLIVLWLVWLLHALVSGHLKTFAALIVTSLLSIVVALAWFGVNLLNIGLHAYGFVSGIAWALVLFICIQGTLIGILTVRAKRKCRQT